MLRWILKKLIAFKDPFWKNVFTLFSGSAIAQALPLIVLPVITRLYTKEALGFYFIYAAIGFVTQIVVSLQFQLSILLPKEKKDADNLFIINLIIITTISVLMLIGIWLGFNMITRYIEQKELTKWLYAIPLSAFLLGVFNASSYYLNREKQYKIISGAKVLKTVSYSVIHIVLGLIGFITSGLIVGLILGQFVSAVFILYKLVKKTNLSFTFNYNELKKLFVKYKDIPLFNTLISFLNTLSNQLPLFLLTRFYGVGSAGDYGLANRIIGTPLDLISQSVGQVFYQEAAAKNNNQQPLLNSVTITYKRLLKIGFVPVLLIILFIPYIIKILFGEDYLMAATILQIITPWLFLGFISRSVSSLMTILKKQRFMSIINFVVLIFRFLAVYLGYYYFNNVLISIALYSLIGVSFNIFQMFYFIAISKKNVTY